MLQAGFSRVDVTPPLGVDLSGYFYRRMAKGIRDPLYVNALAIGDGTKTVILMAIDYIGIKLEPNTNIRNMIADGADTFIEIGPGRTLTNMIRKISTEVRALTCFEYLEEAEGC